MGQCCHALLTLVWKAVGFFLHQCLHTVQANLTGLYCTLLMGPSAWIMVSCHREVASSGSQGAFIRDLAAPSSQGVQKAYPCTPLSIASPGLPWNPRLSHDICKHSLLPPGSIPVPVPAGSSGMWSRIWWIVA